MNNELVGMLMKGPVSLDDLGYIALQLEDIAKYIRTRSVRMNDRGQPGNPFVDILGSRDFNDPMQTYIAQLGRE